MKKMMIFKKFKIALGILTILVSVNGMGYAMVTDNPKEEGAPMLERDQTPQYAPGEVLVKFKEDADPSSILKEAGIEAQGIQRIHSIKPAVVKFKKDYKLEKDPKGGWYSFLGKQYKEVSDIPDEEMFKEAYKNMPEVEKALYRSYKVELPEGVSVEDAISKLKNNPNVEYAEPNYILKIQMVPNDPSYDELWGLQRIQCEQAWDVSQGEGVIVAVIDTGVDYNHPDLWDNVWVNPALVPDRNGDGKIDLNDSDINGNHFIEPSEIVDNMFGWDFAYDDNNPMDGYGHGTHVAGTISAVGNNSIGVIGVAPKAKIMILKGLRDKGSGYIDKLASCVTYAADQGAHILSNSWGGIGTSQTLADDFHYAHSMGCVAVAAAGNEHIDASNITPANIDTVIAVAALHQQADQRCIFSNYGNKVDFIAPGQNILSTIPDGQYGSKSGTSMACPHVAGLAALILSKNPSLSQEDVRNIIGNSAADIGYTGRDNESGFGIPNAKEALLNMDSNSYSTAIIANPRFDDVINNDGYVIMGTAAGNDFSYYDIEIGSTGLYPVETEKDFRPIVSYVTTPVSGDVLASFNPADFLHEIGKDRRIVRLSVYDTSGHVSRFSVSFTIDPALLNGWPVRDNYEGYTAPRAIDINLDGQDEILYTTDYYLFVYKGDGSLLWYKYMQNQFAKEPAIGDLDVNYPGLEIAVSSNGFGADSESVYVYHCDGTDAPGWPIVINDGIYPPVIADFNGDASEEVLFSLVCGLAWTPEAKRTNYICLYNGNGVLLSGWPIDFTGYQYKGAAAADIDKDDSYEILFSVSSLPNESPCGSIRVYNYKGEEIAWARIELDNMRILTAPVIGDLEHDGNYEIIALCCDAASLGKGKVYAWAIDANKKRVNLLPNWPRDIEGDDVIVWASNNEISLADLDNNGVLEIIATHPRAHYTHVWQKNGDYFPDFPTRWYYSDFPEIIGDMDGDGKVELAHASFPWGTYAYKPYGAVLSGFPKLYPPSKQNFCRAPALGDVNNDGMLEMVVGNYDLNEISVYRLGQKGFLAWPMLYHDAQNTNNYNHKLVNSPPILSPIGNKDIDEGAQLQFTVCANDPYGGVLAYSASQLPSGATFNPATKTFAWTPTYDQAGTYTNVHFEVTDGTLKDEEDITITVNNQNRAPDLAPIGSKSTNENQKLEFTISATDPDGDALTYSASNLPVGATFNTTTRTFTWTPSYTQAGSYNVTFVVSDGLLTDEETIIITVNDVTGQPLNWYPSVSNPANQAVYAQGVSHSGSRSLKIVNTVVDYSYWYGDTINFSAPYPKTFALSGWAKGQGISSGSWIPMYYYVVFEDDSSNMYYIADLMFPTGSYNWKNRSITYTFNKGVKAIKPFLQLYGRGTVWFDDISISTINNYLTNPNMEQGTAQPNNWNTYNNDLNNQTGWATDASYSPTHSLKIINTQHKNAGWYGSTVTFNQPYPKTVKFGGYSKSKNVSLRSGGLYCLDFYIKFEDDSIMWYYPSKLRFTAGTHGWQKKEITTTFAKGIKEIRPYCLLYNGTGTCVVR